METLSPINLDTAPEFRFTLVYNNTHVMLDLAGIPVAKATLGSEAAKRLALFAAAPEMLEALGQALEAAKDRRPGHVGRLEAAIAKAEGRA